MKMLCGVRLEISATKSRPSASSTCAVTIRGKAQVPAPMLRELVRPDNGRRTSPMGRFRALSSHDFRLLFFGQLVSLTGTQMQHVAVLWQLYVLTRSPVSLGMIGLFRVIPVLLFATFGGVIADAIDRRKLMLLTQTALACASAILAIATYTEHISPPMIYAVLFLSGMAVAFEVPARQALLPQLVSKDDLPNALSLHAMAWQLAAISGPSIAGFAIDRVGVVPIYIIDVISFLAVIVALLAM